MWKASIDERLVKWQKLRNHISSLPLDKALEEVAEIWAQAPFKTYFLNFENSKEWPDPWSLIIEPRFCDIAKCLGIIYTIYFTSYRNTIELELRIYQDTNKCQLYALVFVNSGQYILNYYSGEIVNIQQIQEKKLQLIYQYTIADLELEKY